MSVEELLKPRYKVIAEYPNSPFDIDEILSVYKGNNYVSNLDAQIYTDRYPEKYPAIFRKLEWWEERDEKDMPEYVKTFYDYGDKIPYQYFKIERWDMGNVRGIINKINRKVITLNGLVKPCSEQEYLNYINKTNENK